MKLSSMAWLCWFCLSLAACDGGESAGKKQAALPPPLVTILKMEPADVPLYATFMGQTEGSRSAAVKPQVSGILQERLFEEGARVEKGAPLFRIDPAPFKAALEQAQGQLASAQSRLENARREYLRAKKLYRSDAVSQQERDSAQAAFLGARAETESARAALDEARIRLAYTRVDAPLSGWTSREVSTVGSLVDQNSTLTLISQNDPMDVHFAVPSMELAAMRTMEEKGKARSYGQGSPVTLHLHEGGAYELSGAVVFLDTQVDAATSTVRAKARFSNPKGLLLPGQFAPVRVGGACLLNALMLPQGAVLQTESGPCVYVLDDGNRAELRPVELGPAFGAEFLVEKGLEAGQRVVVRGQDKVRSGQQVEPQEVSPPRKAGKPSEGKPLEMPGSMPATPSGGGVDDAPAPVFERPESSRRPSGEGERR